MKIETEYDVGNTVTSSDITGKIEKIVIDKKKEIHYLVRDFYDGMQYWVGESELKKTMRTYICKACQKACIVNVLETRGKPHYCLFSDHEHPHKVEWEEKE